MNRKKYKSIEIPSNTGVWKCMKGTIDVGIVIYTNAYHYAWSWDYHCAWHRPGVMHRPRSSIV